MSKLYKALKTNEVFQQIEEKNNIALLRNLTKPGTEDKAVFLTTLKRWYAELTPEEAAQYADKVVDVVETETPAETATADETPKAEKKEKKAKEPKAPKEKATAHIESLVREAAKELEDAGHTVDVADKFLLIDGKKVLHILKTGISIRESVAKDNNIEYERKGYNHPFKAKVEATTVEAIKDILPKLVVENQPVETETVEVTE